MNITFGALGMCNSGGGPVRPEYYDPKNPPTFDYQPAVRLGLTLDAIDYNLPATPLGEKILRRTIDAAKAAGVTNFHVTFDLDPIWPVRQSALFKVELAKFFQTFPEVRSIGLLREPNGRGITATKYVAFQDVAVPMIRHLAPNVGIVSACLGVAEFDPAWIWAREAFKTRPMMPDAFGLNWLGSGWQHALKLNEGIANMRSIIGDREIILTECGSPGEPEQSNVLQGYDLITMSQIAIAHGITIIYAPWMRAGILKGTFKNHGILNEDGSPRRPSYEMLRQFIASVK